MIQTTEHITPAELRAMFRYDPESGLIFWARKLNSRADRTGMVAGSVRPTKYINIIANGKSMMGHRVAWALHYGEWPKGFVDHINGDRADNRITNLRLANNAENQANRGPNARRGQRAKGVDIRPSGRWRASIGIKGKTIYLGTFDTEAQAADAYNKAASSVFGDFFKKSEVRD